MSVLEIKATVRKRDGYQCTKCNMTRAEHFARYERDLEVHRLTPGSEYTLEGCITVCCSCHGSEPKRPRGSCRDRLAFHLEQPLLDAVESLVETTRPQPTITSVIVAALEEYLAARGAWPPPAKPQE